MPLFFAELKTVLFKDSSVCFFSLSAFSFGFERYFPNSCLPKLLKGIFIPSLEKKNLVLEFVNYLPSETLPLQGTSSTWLILQACRRHSKMNLSWNPRFFSACLFAQACIWGMAGLSLEFSFNLFKPFPRPPPVPWKNCEPWNQVPKKLETPALEISV